MIWEQYHLHLFTRDGMYNVKLSLSKAEVSALQQIVTEVNNGVDLHGCLYLQIEPVETSS